MNAPHPLWKTPCRRLGSTLLLMAGLALASHVAAGDDPVDERLKDLQRDGQLIQTLVDGSFKLANMEDPLDRADQLSRMADTFAKEIKEAVKSKDAMRAAHLSEQMQQLMVQGVAVNLNLARASMEPDSPREPQMARVGAQVAGSTKTIEDEIGRHPTFEPAKMKSTLQAVTKSRNEVEKAMNAKSKGKAKTDKGKKGKF